MHASQFLKKLKNLTIEDLTNKKGIGPIMAKNIIDFTNSQRFETLLTKFEKLEEKGKGVDIQSSQTIVTNGPLTGETICITGSFSISRSEIKEKLEALGAKVTDSVTSSTTILLAGEKAGSKLDKAEKLGVRVESDLNKLLEV